MTLHDREQRGAAAKMARAARLELPPEEMRALGYRVVDMLVEHFATVEAKPPLRRAGRPETEALLREPAPEAGTEPAALLAWLEREVFTRIAHLDHPRFLGFIPSPSNWMSVLGDALASGFNVFQGAWLESAATSQIERVTLDWLREACGLPAAGGGILVSGGSLANLTGLAVARHVALGDDASGAVLYCSDQTHASVLRDLRVLGLAGGQVRCLPAGPDGRLPVDVLARALTDDRAGGRRPWCVVANAGTTNTGAVDPLPELAALCAREGLWFHVDGAHGAAAVLCEAGRAALAGIERADTLVLDPHKWLFQPYEIGGLLVREERWLPETFRTLPEYLKITEGLPGETNYKDHGIQLTRGARALKLWLSIKTFGLAAFREAIARGIAAAGQVEAWLREDARWEVVSPAQLAIVCFRYAPPGMAPAAVDALNGRMADALNDEGYAFLSPTAVGGRTVLRFCTINPRLREADLRGTLARLAALGEALAADPAAR